MLGMCLSELRRRGRLDDVARNLSTSVLREEFFGCQSPLRDKLSVSAVTVVGATEQVSVEP